MIDGLVCCGEMIKWKIFHRFANFHVLQDGCDEQIANEGDVIGDDKKSKVIEKGLLLCCVFCIV